MKTLIFLSALFFSTLGFADHYSNENVLDCRVTKMVEHYFDESLSAEEYPDVEVARSASGEYSVQLGVNTAYEASEGDKVTFVGKERVGSIATVQTQHDETITIEVEWRKTLAIGRIKIKEKAERPRTIAHIVCATGFVK